MCNLNLRHEVSPLGRSSIKVNGKLFSVEENTNITELLKIYGIKDSTSTAIEYNDNIIKKDLWDSTILKYNDVVEIVSFVGGG